MLPAKAAEIKEKSRQGGDPDGLKFMCGGIKKTSWINRAPERQNV